MSNPDMVELAEHTSESAHVKCAHEIMNKLLPNHLLSFQIMKKKNTGVKEVIQGHRAKPAGVAVGDTKSCDRQLLKSWQDCLKDIEPW
jgi:hypothetical protein